MPFVSDWEASAAIRVNEKTTMAVNSGGPNLRAMLANGAASRINMMSENVSPKIEEYSAIFMAFPGLPCWASG